MKFKSDLVGVVVTGLYLALVVTLVYLKRDTLPSLGLNEVGDFLAGVFGPVAFLWLILGYLQQGRELKLSSEALLLQAAELKNSVEQQTYLVDVGREQIFAQSEAFKQAQRRYEQGMNARFIFTPGAYIVSSTEVTNSFEVSNVGGDAFNVMLLSGVKEISFHKELSVIKSGQTVTIKLKFDLFDQDCLGTLYCFYKTRDGRKISFDMNLYLSAETHRISITPEVKAEDI